MAKSIEPKVTTWSNTQITSLGWSKHASEQMSVDEQIDESLLNNPSKRGGEGGGRPDYSIIIENGEQAIPVLLEYKGTKNKLIKLDKQNLVVLRGANSEFDFKFAIPQYAVNGAVYYAMNVVKDTDYQEALAIGINGYDDATGETIYEISAGSVAKFSKKSILV